jgi:hypothetical protein
MRKMRCVSPEFVKVIEMKSFLVIDYSLVNVAKMI